MAHCPDDWGVHGRRDPNEGRHPCLVFEEEVYGRFKFDAVEDSGWEE
jgi:hypothetical protein